MGRFGRIALKTILWIVGSIIFLLLLIVILIQVPAVQNFAKNKAVTFLQNKIHTKVQIGHISLDLPKMLVLEDVYFGDQKNDTLIAGRKLKVDISMLELLHHKVEINEINLEGITANINRGADSVFNFDYIIKAFAGEQKKEVKPTDTASTMKFSIDKVIFDNINIAYRDKITGNDIKFLLGHFDTRVKTFDLDKMKFAIPKITLSNVDARIIQTPVAGAATNNSVADTATTPINMGLDLGTIDISKIKVDYRSTTMSTQVGLGTLLVEMNKIDLKNQKVGIKSIQLDNTDAALALAKPQTVKKEVIKAVKKLDTLVAAPQSGKGWAATIDKVTFTNDNVKFDNDATAAIAKGLDFNHMGLKSLNADAENISYNPDTISGKINSFTFREKSGLVLQKFHTAFFYGPKSAYLNDLLVQTPQTLIQKQLQVSYPSIAALSTNLGQLFVNANLDGSRLGLKDVLLLMPAMASMEPFKTYPNAVFKIDGKVTGKVNDLRIPNLEITGLSNTHIKASATMRGLPDVKKAYFDLVINDLNTSSSDIHKLVAANMIPASVSIPANLNLKGTFKGSMSDFNTKMNLRSSYGSVDLTAGMKNFNVKGRTAAYSANVKANDLNVGALTKQPQMVGRITLAANIKGTGTDPKHANLQFSGDVASAYVKGYLYRNLVMSGTARNGSYTAKARMKDPNINFDLDAVADMNRKYPSVKATLLLDSINLQNLHFTKDYLSVRGKVAADVPTADPDHLNANIQVTDLLVAQPKQTIRIDSISLISTANADSSTLKLKTPFLYAHMAGKYKFTEIAPALQDVINKYYNTDIAKAPVKAKVKYSPQQFGFDMRIVKTPLVTQFAPALTTLNPVYLNGHFDSQAGDLTVNGSVPKIVLWY